MEVQAAAKKAARETAEAEGAAVVQWLLSVWALSLVVAFLPALYSGDNVARGYATRG